MRLVTLSREVRFCRATTCTRVPCSAQERWSRRRQSSGVLSRKRGRTRLMLWRGQEADEARIRSIGQELLDQARADIARTSGLAEWAFQDEVSAMSARTWSSNSWPIE